MSARSLPRHSSLCECRACLCDCGAYQYEPMEKCHPDCSYNTVGRMSDHCYPSAAEYRITYF
ncbi:hypothetical protein [Streptomyces bottropensis]|uniref:hypothetical protein n=1 Tax=Streptomyces bottropensis TaxID=42235 RepID=UPI0036BE1DBD